MTDDVQRFQAEILSHDGGGAYVEVPFPVREVYGTGGQVRVHATLDGHDYRGSIAPMGGGTHVLIARKDVRAAIGKGVGDVIDVTLRRDTDERTVELPPELAAAFAGAPDARERFDRLSYTHRREFAQWVSEAKKQETRDRRATRAVSMVIEGSTR